MIYNIIKNYYLWKKVNYKKIKFRLNYFIKNFIFSFQIKPKNQKIYKII